jgi:hypothetical protein
MAELKNVEIFAIGTWNGFKFVQEDLTQIINNTKDLVEKNELRPRIKLGHSSNQILKGQSDGDPSLGTAQNLRLQGDTIIADFTDLPDIIFELIKNKRFTDISVELDHVKHFGWFLSAVALLGADIPAVKTINDLQKFLSESEKSTSYEVNGNIKLACSEPKLLNKPEKQDTKTMSEDVKNALKLEYEKRELEKKIKDLESKNKDSETQLSKFKEQEQERQFEDEKNQILAPYREQVKKGQLKPAVMNKLESAIDSQKCNFSDGGALMIPANMINEITTAYSEQLPTMEQADDSSFDDSELDVDAKVAVEINKVIMNTNMNYIDACEAVFAANPTLEKEYVGWTNKISYKEV